MPIEESGRYRLVEITGQALVLSLASGNQYRIEEGIPRDAECRSRGYDPKTDTFYLLIESEEFEFVPENQAIPTLEITITESEVGEE